MPVTEQDRSDFTEAIKQKDSSKIREFTQRDDAKELLLMKDDDGSILHTACSSNLDKKSLQVILDAAMKHEIVKDMFELKDGDRNTCLHYTCNNNLSTDSLQVLLEYSLNHADIKTLLEAENEVGWTCFHNACSSKEFSTASLRLLLLEYMSKHADIKKILQAKVCDEMNTDATCLHIAYRHSLLTESLQVILESLLKHADLKVVLEQQMSNGCNCLHAACNNTVSIDSFRLLLDFCVKHGDVKKVLEQKGQEDCTCVHAAASNCLNSTSMRLLLETVSKHGDINKMLQDKAALNDGRTPLHLICRFGSSSDSLKTLVAFFPSNDEFQKALSMEDSRGMTAIDLAQDEKMKEMLQDPECWAKSRRVLEQSSGCICQ